MAEFSTEARVAVDLPTLMAVSFLFPNISPGSLVVVNVLQTYEQVKPFTLGTPLAYSSL